MIIICCNNPCVYEDDGNCTLTHVTSVSQSSNKSCAYFKSKTENIEQKDTNLL